MKVPVSVGELTTPGADYGTRSRRTDYPIWIPSSLGYINSTGRWVI
jgi:hypothetical protein